MANKAKEKKKNNKDLIISICIACIVIAAIIITTILMLKIKSNALLEEIWDAGGDFVNDNTLTVYIKRLREKIEDDPQKPEIIKTVRGLGYRVY